MVIFPARVAVTGYEILSNIGKVEIKMNEEAKFGKSHFTTLNILAYLYIYCFCHLWPLLLTWFNFNPNMDK